MQSLINVVQLAPLIEVDFAATHAYPIAWVNRPMNEPPRTPRGYDL